MFGDKLEDEVAQYLDEICINVPSILINLFKIQDTLEIIDKIEVLCSSYQNLMLTLNKVLLIKLSMSINIKEAQIP